MSQRILIDGDILVYKIAFAMEVPVYVCKNAIFKTKGHAEVHGRNTGFPVSKRINIGHEGDLRKKLKLQMNQMFDDIGSHTFSMFITGEGNFRNTLATVQGYKANRAKATKPQHYRRIRDILIKEYDAIVVNGAEADDALAAHQSSTFTRNKHYEETIIASIDKDMLQVPGWHYNITSRIISFIDPDKGMKLLLQQVLSGDPTDNIPGLCKILKLRGEEAKSKELSNHRYLHKFERFCVDNDIKNCYNYVLDKYTQYGCEKELEEVFNLVWLRRYQGQNGYKDFIEEYIYDK